MILARPPRALRRRRADVAVEAARRTPTADAGRVRPVSPLGPAMVLAFGGVVFSAVRRMRARSRREAAAAARRTGSSEA